MKIRKFDGLPITKVTECVAPDCDNKKCGLCLKELFPEDHSVIWTGPVGTSVHHSCARGYEASPKAAREWSKWR